ncbi:MAG: cupin domain-containing protein [Actinomycetota bacterium]|nr:cupin domain-containing protein [Actinomycetota bacterium]
MTDLWQAAASLLADLGLLGDHSVHEVRRAEWGEGSRYLGRLSGSVWKALERPGPLATNFRLIDSGREIDPSKWRASRVGDGEVLRTVLKARPVKDAIQSGATMAISHLEALDDDILRFSEALEYLLCTRVWVNCYIAKNSGSAFGAHADAHDVVIVQVAGRKQWVVSCPERKEQPILLTPGECLAIPAGTTHEVTGVAEPSVHLTVSFVPFGGLEESMTDAAVLLGSRRPGTDTAEMREQLAMSPERRPGLSFPAALTGVRGTERKIRWASRYPPVVETTESDVLVTSLGKKIRFGRAAWATLCALRQGREYSWCELAECGELKNEELVAFLNFCMDHDLIICQG